MVRIGYAGKPVSQATLSKLKSAMGDPSKTKYGLSLREGGAGRAPDGGALEYWRFLPANLTEIQRERIKKNPKVVYAMERLHNLTGTGRTADASGTATHHMQVIAEESSRVVDEGSTADTLWKIKDLINQRAERGISEEQKAIINRQIKAQQLKLPQKNQVVIETDHSGLYWLEKPTPTAPAITSSFPIIPIIIIAVIVGFFLLRRRA